MTRKALLLTMGFEMVGLDIVIPLCIRYTHPFWKLFKPKTNFSLLKFRQLLN